MSYQQILADELTNNPLGLPYAAALLARDDSAVADILNNSTGAQIGTISRDNLASWAAIYNMHGKIVDFSATAGHVLRDSALSILSVLNGGAAGGIDLTKPANIGILDLWEAQAQLTTEARAAFMAFGTKTVARPFLLGLGRLQTANDVAWVVRDASGNQLIGA